MLEGSIEELILEGLVLGGSIEEDLMLGGSVERLMLGELILRRLIVEGSIEEDLLGELILGELIEDPKQKNHYLNPNLHLPTNLYAKILKSIKEQMFHIIGDV